MAKRIQYQAFSINVLPQPPAALPTFSWFEQITEPVPDVAGKLTRPTISGFQAAAETVSVDRWLQQWSEPVIKTAATRLPLHASFQQFYGANLSPILGPAPPLSWYESPIDVIRPLPRAPHYEAFWWSESAQFPAVATVGNWFIQWSEPVRSKPRAPDFPAAPYQETQQFSEVIVESEWHEPWSTPVWPKPGLGAQYQLFEIFLHTTTTTIVPFLGWFLPLSEPVRVKPRAIEFPYKPWYLGPTSGGNVFIETIFIDKWLQQLSLPVWLKPGLLAGAQQDYMKSDVWPIPLQPRRFGVLNTKEAVDEAIISGTVFGVPPSPPTSLPVTANVGIVQTRPQ